MFKLRFWWVLFWAWISREKTGRSRLRFWVTPFDCDINLHCNNASYLKFMDLGRWDLVVRLGLIKVFFRAKMHPVATRVDIKFFRPMPPGTFFVLETIFGGIEDNRITCLQNFFIGEKLAAEAKVWAAYVKDGHAVKVEEIDKLVSDEIKRIIKEVREKEKPAFVEGRSSKIEI